MRRAVGMLDPPKFYQRDFLDPEVQRRVSAHGIMIGAACGLLAACGMLILMPPTQLSAGSVTRWFGASIALALVGFAAAGTARWFAYPKTRLGDPEFRILQQKAREWESGVHGGPVSTPPPVPRAKEPAATAAPAPERHERRLPETVAAPLSAATSGERAVAEHAAFQLASEAIMGLIVQGKPVTEHEIGRWLRQAAGSDSKLIVRATHLARRIIDGPRPFDGATR
jgi:hypothetical protein